MQSLKGSGFWDWLREEPDHELVEVSVSGTEPIVRMRFIFTGQVQGVGFRYALKESASVFGLTGSAHNEADGTVTAEMQGNPSMVENAVHYVQLLSPYILVDRIEQSELPLLESETDFSTD